MPNPSRIGARQGARAAHTDLLIAPGRMKEAPQTAGFSFGSGGTHARTPAPRRDSLRKHGLWPGRVHASVEGETPLGR